MHALLVGRAVGIEVDPNKAADNAPAFTEGGCEWMVRVGGGLPRGIEKPQLICADVQQVSPPQQQMSRIRPTAPLCT